LEAGVWDYLIAWTKFYTIVGVNSTHLGFLNEPESVEVGTHFSACGNLMLLGGNRANYASMLSNGQQAADSVKVLRPALDATNISNIGITCCQSECWGHPIHTTVTGQLKSAGGEALFGVNGLTISHSYTGALGPPFRQAIRRGRQSTRISTGLGRRLGVAVAGLARP
jgi:hypothetical protein